jgi:hypothetical protein
MDMLAIASRINRLLLGLTREQKLEVLSFTQSAVEQGEVKAKRGEKITSHEDRPFFGDQPSVS